MGSGRAGTCRRGGVKEMRCGWIRQGCIISLVPRLVGRAQVHHRAAGDLDELGRQARWAAAYSCKPLWIIPAAAVG